MMRYGSSSRPHIIVLVAFVCQGLLGCKIETTQPTQQPKLPHDERWGIYSLNLDSQEVKLLYSSSDKITTLRLDSKAGRFVFSQQIEGNTYNHDEIFTLGINGQDLQQLTNNDLWDIYPAWSPDGSKIAFLSIRDSSLDIYTMNADGSQQELLYDSGFHDADIHWSGDQIAFTSQSQLWIMNEDGTDAHPITDPPRRGEWGNANLPFGDYDPRINPPGTHVLFSRMVDDQSSHGNYDLFLVEIDGSNTIPLTNNGYSQGLSSWAPGGERILYVVAAIGEAGVFDLYTMNVDGTDIRNITPDYFPTQFLCHFAIFSPDKTGVYFIGEWWSEE